MNELWSYHLNFQATYMHKYQGEGCNLFDLLDPGIPPQQKPPQAGPQRCTSWRNIALLPQSLWPSVGHGEIYKIGPIRSGTKWSEHFLEMAENKWATGVMTAKPLAVGGLGPLLTTGELTLPWDLLCTNKKSSQRKRWIPKKKKNTSWEKGGNYLPIPCEMGGYLFVTEKGLGLSDSRCTSFFY